MSVKEIQAGACLRLLRKSVNADARLICFPWAGGGGSFYRRFSADIPHNMELWSIQYPGREDRYSEPLCNRMETLVEHIVTDLKYLSDKPMVFFGHSMGALVAYEVAAMMQQRFRREPELLVVSGSGAPGYDRTYVRCRWDESDAVFMEELRRLGGTPAPILEDSQLMQSLLPVIRADYEILDHYEATPEGKLNCPVIFCAGKDDHSVSEYSPIAWRRHSLGVFQEHWFEGDHFYLYDRTPELVKELSDWIFGCREQSRKIRKIVI
ncbi:MAG: alpha/beta fold hydrolase [Gammaproteobacteria bacterium]|nr:alpha/beta fold hydrolase [Gammaproteobacteria bacterium]MDH5801629.1 alpha/beta fold hydrolase [Gammaproteobacteria bacterium]